jgi:hypothetical protein
MTALPLSEQDREAANGAAHIQDTIIVSWLKIISQRSAESLPHLDLAGCPPAGRLGCVPGLARAVDGDDSR